MARRSRPPQLALAAAFAWPHLVASSFQPLARPDGIARTESSPLEEDGGRGAVGRTCWYIMEIKTSCSSTQHTSDAVSLAFGDVYRDEVYATQLGGASSPAFERCAKDTFRIGGPCGYGVCYLYLGRTGRAGWTPEWVRVYEPTFDTSSTFYYGDPLPDGVWYGFNRCKHRASSSSSSSAAARAAAL